jgi:hypothetical protein
MSSLKLLRSLTLAAALMGAAAAPALADGEYISGPSAVGSWQSETRTPLAGNAVQNSAVDSLEQSGATGGGGQHA